MTCIIGLQYNNDTYIIADSQCTIGENTQQLLADTESKILKGKEYTVGIAGDYILNTFLREKSIDNLFTGRLSLDKFIPIKQYLDVFDIAPNFELLFIAHNEENKLYTIDSGFCITSFCDKKQTDKNTLSFLAIGSGQLEARSFLNGALEYINIDSLTDKKIEKILVDTISHVASVNNSVSLPYTIETVKEL